MQQHHVMKCYHRWFEPLWNKTKPFEIRLDDRNYQVGDTVKILDYDPIRNECSGIFIEAEISYILDLESFFGEMAINAPETKGYVIFGMRDIVRGEDVCGGT